MRGWSVSVDRGAPGATWPAWIPLLCSFALLGGCGMRPEVRPIADRIRIDGEWSEIRIDPPLEVHKKVQRVSIAVDDPADWDMRPDRGTFVRPDGTPLKIEIELVAGDGSRFALDSIGLGPGLTFSRLPGEDGGSGSRLPPEETFPILRVRADPPFEGGEVSWICITNY